VVFQDTLTVFPLAAERLTVKFAGVVPEFPSTTLTSETLTVG
jgi:hypothetical protein